MFRIGEGVSQIETCVVRREMLFSSFTCSGRKFAEVEHLFGDARQNENIEFPELDPPTWKLRSFFSLYVYGLGWAKPQAATLRGVASDWTAPFVKENDPPTPDRCK
jgi:hypothetical protein